DGREKNVGLTALDVLDCGFDVVELFTLIAPHEEHAGGDTSRLEHVDGAVDLFDLHATLHRVEDSLRAAFGSDPDAEAAHFSESIGDGIVHAIRARDALEGNANAATFQLGRIVQGPACMDREDVIGIPEKVGVVAGGNVFDLIRNVHDRAAAVSLAE